MAFNPRRGRGRGGGAGGGGGAATASTKRHDLDSTQFAGSTSSTSLTTAAVAGDTDETRELRKKYGLRAKQVKMVFPDWSDESLLSVLQDANGDVELAILRITDGHAQQWESSTTKKKEKKVGGTTASTPAGVPTPVTSASPATASVRGTFGGRGGRGGAESARGGRGGRGVARGARGGARGAYTNGTGPTTNGGASVTAAMTNSSTPASFAESASAPNAESAVTAAKPVSKPAAPAAPVLKAPIWAARLPKVAPPAPTLAPEPTPADALEKEAGSTTEETPKPWGEVPAVPSSPPKSDFGGAPTEFSTTATAGWGEEGTEKALSTAETSVGNDGPLPSVEKATEASTVAAKENIKPKPASKVIAPGSKISWAQIARPPSPPKPAPAPQKPIAQIVTPSSRSAAPVKSTPGVSQAPSVAPVATDAWNSISAPSSSTAADLAPPLVGLATTPVTNDPWGTALAATPVPMAVGEGWADAVVAAQDLGAPYQHQTSSEVKAHLPPNDIETAGPIALSAPELEPEPASQSQRAASDFSMNAGPPGLTKRTSHARPSQQDSVVLPHDRTAPGLDRVGVQFGSLNLMDGQPPYQQDMTTQQQQAQQQAPTQQQAQQQQHQQVQEQPSYSQESIQQQYAQQQQHHQYQQYQQAQHNSQSNLLPQQQQHNSAFATRYPANSSPYGQQPQQADESQQQQQQQQATASSPYTAFKTETGSSPYSQYESGAASLSTNGPSAHGQQQQQQPTQTGYNQFSSMSQGAGGQQQQQQQAAYASSQSDYSALYGQEALRNMGFYDQYGQVNAGSGYQNASPLPTNRVEDGSSGSASHTPNVGAATVGAVTPGSQTGHQGQSLQGTQTHPQQPAYGHGMMPYYPYGFYQAYNPQSYQQVPPNYGALQQQYGQQPYGGYLQQQYPGARNMQGQYTPQQQQQQQQQQQTGGGGGSVGHSQHSSQQGLGGFRQQQQGNQQQGVSSNNHHQGQAMSQGGGYGSQQGAGQAQSPAAFGAYGNYPSQQHHHQQQHHQQLQQQQQGQASSGAGGVGSGVGGVQGQDGSRKDYSSKDLDRGFF